MFIPVWHKSGKGVVAKPWFIWEEAYKLARKSNKPEDWEQFKIQQRRTKGLIKKVKIENESKSASIIKTDCKHFYRYAKRKRLTKTNVGPLQSETENS